MYGLLCIAKLCVECNDRGHRTRRRNFNKFSTIPSLPPHAHARIATFSRAYPSPNSTWIRECSLASIRDPFLEEGGKEETSMLAIHRKRISRDISLLLYRSKKHFLSLLLNKKGEAPKTVAPQERRAKNRISPGSKTRENTYVNEIEVYRVRRPAGGREEEEEEEEELLERKWRGTDSSLR